MLTRESLRADIAAIIHADPDEIGGGDDLLDHGLDSLRAMTLLVGWSETGLQLDFGEFAEKLTLDAWWTIVDRQQRQAG